MKVTTVAPDVSRTLQWSKKLNWRISRDHARAAHLQDIVGQAEDDGRVEPVVLDEEVHADGAGRVPERPVDRALELLGHVVVEVAEEVDFAVELGRVLGQRVM